MATTAFEVDSWVWMPDDDEMYLPAKVWKTGFNKGDEGKVKTEDGETHTLSAKVTADLMPCNEEVLSSDVDNLIKLNDLNEQAILHNLRIRFKEDQIYTYVSTILISVNPFKLLPLYTPEMLDKYKEQGSRDLPPHVFAVGDNAYRQMLGDNRSQSVVISGESGAGKTEATKLILQFLAEVSGRASGAGNTSSGLEQQILQANPVMEAFGNAKTLRNNNSSRFGKLISVKFNRAGTIVGGSIINYLLEKVRVVQQMEGERNYHIFYQLLAGCEADPTLRGALGLSEPAEYHYTNQSGVTSVDGMSDEKEFEDMVNAMETCLISKEDQMSIFKIVAGVLNVGNIEFEADVKATEEDGAKVKNEDAVAKGASMFGVDTSELKRTLTSRNIGSRSVIMVSYSVKEANDARDALTKFIYAKLFDNLIVRINDALAKGLASGETAGQTINVLDIFGFESFETNSFEQLCINYCNEKLQFHFNEHIFKLEQREYAAEGVDVPDTAFVDNQPCLDLLEKPRTGVFAMIDEEISVPKGSDDGFLSKVLRDHGKHANLKRPKPKEKDARVCFNIVHFAGEVSYNVTGFLEKNKDTLHPDIQAVMRDSSDAMVKTLMTAGSAEASSGGGRGGRTGRKAGGKQPTLGAQFKKQLSSLMETLNATFPHFVRTMKSNDAKKGDIFTCSRMLDQLRYAGLLEVCRIRQIGYPVRREFDEFFKRYRCLVDGAADLEDLLSKLTAEGKLTDKQWARGKNKLFFKNQQASDLEAERETAFTRQTVKVQRAIRALLMRVKYARFHEVLSNVKTAISARDAAELEKWMDMSAELPNRGVHIKVIKDGRQLLLRLQEEARINRMLEEAMKARSLSDCEAAIAAAEAMKPAFDSPQLQQARDLLDQLRKEKKLKADLSAATKARDLSQLSDLLAQADAIPLDCEEVRQARATKERLEEEAACVSKVRDAITAESLSELTAWLAKMSELGLEAKPEFAEGSTLRDKLLEKNKAREALAAATKERDLGTLQSAIVKAEKLGVAGDELTAAQKLVEQLKKEQEAEAKLQSACDGRDLSQVEAAVAEAEGLGLEQSKSSALAAAKELLEQLNAEAACREALKAATASNDGTQLSKALAEASKLNLEGSEVDAARTASKALGAQSQARTELADAAATGDRARIEAAIAAAKGAGQGDCPEMGEAEAALTRIGEEDKALAALEQASKARNLSDLSRALATAQKMGLEKRAGDKLAAAKQLVDDLGVELKLNLQLKAAQKSGDLESINAALAKAKEAGIDNEEVARTKLQAEVTEELAAATDAGNKDQMKIALQKAAKANIDTEQVRQARIVVDREQLVKDTSAQMAKAVKGRDLDGLNAALERVIELGMEGAEVDAAKTLRDELAAEAELTEGLRSAMKAMQLKAESPAGIAPTDIEPLSAAIAAAQGESVPDDNADMVAAHEMQERMNEQIEVQGLLANAIASQDYHELKDALNRSEDLILKIDAVSTARKLMREVDAERRRQQAAGELSEEEIDEEELERERQERLKKASSAKYHFTNYANIRSVDDFAKGVILNKKKVKEGMLKWQATVLQKSLLELEKDLNKMACRIHKSVLGYMGDKTMSFPATLAQDILQKGLEIPELIDEIYMQIMKQLTNNPKPESIARGWQLMCMCVGTFPPSREFENHLLNYVLEKKDSTGAVGNYARYSLRRLEGMLSSGASGFVPSVEEIQSYKERPPILATIELVDGTPLTEELPVTPDLNVAKVLEICTHFLDLQDERANTFGVFVVDVEAEDEEDDMNRPAPPPPGPVSELIRTPRPLRNEDFMGDVCVQKARQGRAYKFVFKRKIFIKEEDLSSDDEMFNRLIYLQAADEVIIGNIPVADENVIMRLVAGSIAVDLADEFPDQGDDLLEAECIEYVPVPWRAKYGESEWADKILALRDAVISEEPESLQQEYVNAVQHHELFGTHFFHVKKVNDVDAISSLPQKMIAAFNSDGLHFLDDNRRILMSYGYADIYRWGGSSVQFSLIIWNADTQDTFEMILSTSQAADMAALILDFINAIMASTQQ